MSCYTKIKKALEKGSGVKVERSKNIITIKKDKKVLTTYDLKFVEFSKGNTNNFIDYWKYILKISKKKEKKKMAKSV